MDVQRWLGALTLILGCHEDCVLCVGSQADECIRCGTNASLVPVHGAYIGSCVCNAAYCPRPNARSCGSGCDPSCFTCSGCGANQCTVCTDIARATLFLGTCICQTPNFCVMDASGLCQAGCTNSECLTCNSCGGNNVCASCDMGATLISGNCQCSSGFEVFDSHYCQANCAMTMNTNGAKCECMAGFYPKADHTCGMCSGYCSECTGPSADECTLCISSDATPSSNPGQCACNKGYFPNPDANNCSQCDSTCIYCSGSGAAACYQCQSTMTLTGPPPASCGCPASSFWDGSSCTSCDSTCATCQSTGPTQCLTCVDTNASIASPPGTCACVVGYFGTPNSCTQCAISCKTCSGGGANSCVQCFPNATKDSSGACVCNSGFWPNANASNCSACDVSCNVCSNQTTCDICYPNASASGGLCTCGPHYYPNMTPANCSSCDVNCLACSGPNQGDCSSCSPNAHSSSGACVCDNGFYPNTDANSCAVCGGLCATCQSGAANACVSCPTNGTLAVTPGPSTCSCDPGYAWRSSDRSCVLCASTCATCSDSLLNSCLSCKASAQLNGVAPTNCVCIVGTYPASDASNCVLCHSDCVTCSGSANTQCTSCQLPAILITGTCLCPSHSTPRPDAQHCVMCDSTCSQCVSTSSSSCSACYLHAHVATSAPGSCICDSGYFPLSDSANCLPCASMCQTCFSAVTCLSCYNNAELQADSSCTCREGYYGSPASCATCVQGCQVCNAVGCTQCSTNWYLYEKSCVTACPLGYFAQNRICEHGDLIPPDPSMFVNPNNSLTVSFSKPINMNLTASDINIAVTDTAHVSYSLVWSNPLVLNQSSLLLTLTIDSPTLPDDNQCQLTFLHPSTVVDLLGVALVKDQLLGVLYGFGKATYNATMKANAATVAQGSVGAVAATSIISGSPSSFWSLLNQLQLISYIPMTRMPVPDGLKATLGALNVGSFVPNPFGYVLPSNESSQLPPDYAQSYGVSSSLFLLNTGLMMGTAFALLLSFTTMHLLSKLTTGFLSLYLRRFLPSFKWGIPLRWWIQSYLDISIYSLLEIQQILTHNGLSAVSVSINFLLSLALTCCALLTPLLAYVFLWAHYDQLTSRKDSVFNKRWGEFYMEFDKRRRLGGLIYYPLFLTRRLVYALTIIWMADYAEVQAVINTSMALAVPLT